MAFVKQEVLSPAHFSGNILLAHDTIDQTGEPRKAWIYNTGQRRVRRAPQIAYDGRNDIWRVSEAHEMQYYNYDVPLYAVDVTYEFLSGRYVVAGMENEEAFGVNRGKRFSRKEFSPNELRNNGVR